VDLRIIDRNTQAKIKALPRAYPYKYKKSSTTIGSFFFLFQHISKGRSLGFHVDYVEATKFGDSFCFSLTLLMLLLVLPFQWDRTREHCLMEEET
jgi:hypothetical protein